MLCTLSQSLVTNKSVDLELVAIAVKDRMQVLARMQTTQQQCTENARKALNINRAHSDTIGVGVLHKGHVRSCVAATVKSVGTLTCCLAIARMLLVQVFCVLMTNATTYYYLTQL